MKRIRALRALAATLAVGAALAGCTNKEPAENRPVPSSSAANAGTAAPSDTSRASGEASGRESTAAAGSAGAVDAAVDEQPSIVYYEIFVRSFADSDGDGIGDLNGIAGKLDYLQKLGVEGIWLTPINPSPSYHGYDVTDYYGVNPEFGTMDDFKKLLAEAHGRGMKVIMDLVVNHTSSQHPWFVDSASGKDAKRRDWYLWAEDQGLSTAAASAQGGVAWHEKNGGHYEATFWDGMPDLNFDNPEVREEMKKIGRFWLGQGVDGFRLDAAKHVYEDFKSQAGDKEVAKKNQLWWQEFRQGLNEANPNAYLVGEVWSSSAAVAPYLNGAFDSSFNFDVSDWIRGAVVSGRASSMTAMLPRYYALFAKESGGRFVDAPFANNHDRDRLMSLVQGDANKAKLAASLLLTLPGNPFLYYGEEIGLRGSGADERKREPMLWTAAAGGEGETSWEPLVANRGREASVEEQIDDPNSLFNHYRKFIELRKKEPALRDGALESMPTASQAIAAYVRTTGKEKLYVAHNLTGEALTAKVDERSAAAFSEILFATGEGASYEDGNVAIPPYGTVILR
ncbi:alpha-amylase family glycosyl hydrolase [Cohnella xylanilytica]|uniref:alpha-amylase family glycosyl hydrolase n=1 Tax=Cohnella xylanilytica TaxID=557555 RepID=UPI001FE33EBF|nr:alpha-amylase family glycosyl hydrolase [Cohnella xylanilytica]